MEDSIFSVANTLQDKVKKNNSHIAKIEQEIDDLTAKLHDLKHENFTLWKQIDYLDRSRKEIEQNAQKKE